MKRKSEFRFPFGSNVSVKLLVAGGMVLLVSCGHKSQIEMTRVENPEREKQTVISDPGINEADAVKRLESALKVGNGNSSIGSKNAESSDSFADVDPGLWQVALNEIRSRTRPGFNWSLFWAYLKRSNIYHTLPGDNRYSLWQFLEKDCSSETYNDFVQLLATYPSDLVYLGQSQDRDGLSRSEGPIVPCKNSLNKETWESTIKEFGEFLGGPEFEISRETSRGYLPFILFVNQQLTLSSDWLSQEEKVSAIARYLSGRVLRRIISGAIYDSPAAVVEFIDRTRGYGNLPEFANEFVEAEMTRENGPSTIELLGKHHGFDAVVDLLMRADREIFVRVASEIGTESRLEEVVQLVTTLFEVQSFFRMSNPETPEEELAASAVIRRVLLRMKSLRILEAHIQGEVPNAKRRFWLRNLHRWVEKQLREARHIAKEVLDDLLSISPDPDLEWLRFRWVRFFKRDFADYEPHLVNWRDATGLNRLLWSRLAVHLAKEPRAKHLAIQTHCRILRDEYGRTSRYAPDESDDPIYMLTDYDFLLTLYGCHTVRVQPGKNIISEEEENHETHFPKVELDFSGKENGIAMDPDTILIAPGIDLTEVRAPDWRA